MGKYRELIDHLYVDGERHNLDVRKALVEADGRALPALVHALHNHPKADTREEIAEILGERGSAKAIPALIQATGDPCVFVRQDASWSIGMICEMEPASLENWLDISYDNRQEMKKKIEKWWKVNRQFIEGNDAFL